ncbi:CHAT domain-containing protein [Streptomyces sp. NPDC046881]|uniref:CHAT domain-containing protein n=1 Tax=Streptomyces sp. NPDC046881 TaxID=3155374 RepID=UPI0033D4663E
MRDRLLHSLGDRLRKADQGDVMCVLEREALVDAVQLLAMAVDETGTAADYCCDIETAHTLGRLHWYRCRLLPAAFRRTDQERAFALFAGLQRIAPTLVPAALRDEIATYAGPVVPVVADHVHLECRAVRIHDTGGDLAEAADLLRAAAAAAPAGSRDQGLVLSNLCGVLRELFGHNASLPDLESAVAAGRQALGVLPADEATWMIRSNLAMALLDRFHTTKDPADLSEAVGLLRQSLSAAPGADSRFAPMLGLLCSSLFRHYAVCGDPAVLGESIDVGLRSLALTGKRDEHRALLLDDLINASQERYARLGDLADINAAFELAREALGLAEHGSRRHARLWARVAVLARIRFVGFGQTNDLETSVTMLRCGDSPSESEDERADRLSELSASLQVMHRHLRGDATDVLDEAVDTGREAVKAATEANPMRWDHIANLAAALALRGEIGRDSALLDEAAELLTLALKLCQDTPQRCRLQINLAAALERRWDLRGDETDRTSAIAALRKAATAVDAPPDERIEAAERWGRLATDAGRIESGQEGYATALDLLPLLSWPGLDQVSQEQRLMRVQGLASAAAAAALVAGDSERAVTILEHGRSMLWTRLTQIRADLAALEENHPEARARLAALGAGLDPSTDREIRATGESFRSVADRERIFATRRQQRTGKRMATARAWEATLDSLRTTPGWEHFLRPSDTARLRASLRHGPVTVVNTSAHRCDALIVHADRIDLVPLTDLSMSDAIARTDRFITALTEWEHGDAGSDTVDPVIGDTLEWLWDTVAEPVLARLGHLSSRGGPDGLPRLWWCPTGPLTVLPLHAAGSHRDGAPGSGRSALDRVVSSYTPTLNALSRAAAPSPATPGSRRLLAVAVPHAPGEPSLPRAVREAEFLASCFIERHTSLLGPQATRDNVREAVTRHAWVHFACHGEQNASLPTRVRAEGPRASGPLNSGLRLHDGLLTVADIADLRPDDAEFAFLSACKTALGGGDEGINLVNAMHLAGYRHVIGTLWSVPDPVMGRLVKDFHHRSSSDGRFRPETSARALHGAVQSLRHRFPQNPSRWAPFVHTGP